MIAVEPREQNPSRPSAARVRRHRSTSRSRLLATGAVAAWLLVVVAGRAWALRLTHRGVNIVLFTPPILGGERAELPITLLFPIGVAIVIVIALPPVVERLRWWVVVALSTLAATGWWLALALVDGVGGLTRGLYWQADYADGIARAATDPGAFLHSYVPDLASYPIALRGHPPGFVLLFALLDRLGLSGPDWAAFAVLLVGASGVAAVLATVRAVAGEMIARRAAPFVVLAPAAIWIATSTDALTMGVAAWVVAMIVLAGQRRDRWADALAVGAGLLAAFVALQSYGLVLLGLPILLIAVAQRRLRPSLIGAVVALGVMLTFSFAGYSWLEGLFATMHQYHTLDLDRPYVPFLIINLAAWALALGPATIAGMARTRDRRVWLLVGGGAVAALAANVSGLSSGEVERIWLPFTIWVLPVGAVLWTSWHTARGWLALQALVAISLTAAIATNW